MSGSRMDDSIGIQKNWNRTPEVIPCKKKVAGKNLCFVEIMS